MPGKQAGAIREADGLYGLKAAIHEYVKQVNRAELEQRADGMAGLVRDTRHAERLNERLARLRALDAGRGVYSPRQEAKARIVRLREGANEVEAVLQLHYKRSIEHGGAMYTEERIETERLLLGAAGGQWLVLHVEPEVRERRRQGEEPAAVDAPAAVPGGDRLRHAPDLTANSGTIPYINYDLLPSFSHHRQAVPYRRDLAAAYADRWWNESNPAYETFDVNCTNYVSQCLFAGHAPMNYTGKRATGWWYKGRSGGQEWWSFSWAVSHALQTYLASASKEGLQASLVQNPGELRLGDAIMYDWDGNGRFQHSTVVTAFDRDGQPLVNANTTPSRHRYWDYRDSYAWTERTQYRLYHIANVF